MELLCCKAPGAPFWAAIRQLSLSLSETILFTYLWPVPPSSQLIHTRSRGAEILWFLWVLNGSHNAWHIVGAQSIFAEWTREYLMGDDVRRDGDMNTRASHLHRVARPKRQNWPKSVKTGGGWTLVSALETREKCCGVLLRALLFDAAQTSPLRNLGPERAQPSQAVKQQR